MNTYIAFLKGINVGGHKKVPMAALREVLSKSGIENVKTYIQSGNVVFQSPEKNSLNLETSIQKSILNKFGFEVSVLVRTRQELLRIFNNSPFPEDKKVKSYFTMLHTIPDPDLVAIASEKIYEGEEYYIVNDCIYFYCEQGYGKAKFNMIFFEQKLKTFATARNYNTMVKLIAISSENN